MSLPEEPVIVNTKKNQPKYYDDTRKHYYLASNKENIAVLLKNQEKELTDILVDYKNELNIMFRERQKKAEESNKLDKKINRIQNVDKNNFKQLSKSKSQNDLIESSINIKKKKKEELEYENKTLLKELSKLKNDMLVIKSDINIYDEKNNQLKKNLFQQKLLSNNIKLEYNQVYSKILEQNKKNNYEKNENDLQIKYYNTVIAQKSSFIHAGDERLKRQSEIEAREKKENSDKIEVEKRHKLQLLRLFNIYLEKKMSTLLKKYENIEKNFNKIKNITGTSDLSKIVDEILNKNKNYQLKLNEVKKKQDLIKKLEEDINKLNNKMNNIIKKYGVITDNEIINNKRDLDKEELDLEKNENELNEKYLNLQKLNQKVSLVYENVKSNILKLYDDMIEWAKKENKDGIYKTEINENYDNINDEIKEKFENFTYNSEKKINMLFLCHSKQELFNIIKQKGKKINLQMDDNFKKIFNKIKLEKPKLKKQLSDAMITSLSNFRKNDQKDDFNLKEKENQDLIFNTFLKEYKLEKIKEMGLITEKK